MRIRASDQIPVCILYSSSGPYASLGTDAIAGAMAAIAEINRDDAYDFQIKPILYDPGGDAENYAHYARQAIERDGCRHVIGTITSWSRKEVLPMVERRNALLWYAFPYEGYEASDHAIYLGACPNQHLIPLFRYVFPRFGLRACIVGSNYIWGWEIGRIAREFIEASGGEVLSERYIPIGSTEIDHVLEEISQKKPDFILSNLVGEASNAFISAYGAQDRKNGAFAGLNCPIVSCNATEFDLTGLGNETHDVQKTSPGFANQLLTTSIYFDQLNTIENSAFKANLAARYGSRVFSSPFVSVYMAVSMLAQAIAEAASDDPETIRTLVTGRSHNTPVGQITIDPKTHHAALPVHLGWANRFGQFDVVETCEGPIVADPYLVHTDPVISVPSRSQGVLGKEDLLPDTTSPAAAMPDNSDKTPVSGLKVVK